MSMTNEEWRRLYNDLASDYEALEHSLRREKAANERLMRIIDTPDPKDFLNASVKETQYQNFLWGDEEGHPSAWGDHNDPAWLSVIDHLGIKVLNTPDTDLEKKLHRITTIAAAAANWHRDVLERSKSVVY